MDQSYDRFLKLIDTENKVLMRFLDIIARIYKESKSLGDSKLLNDIEALKNDFTSYINDGGHMSGFTVSERDINTINEACNASKGLSENENFAFEHICIKNMTDDNYTLIFKDSDYSKVNEMCKYLIENNKEFDFKYESLDLEEGLTKNFENKDLIEFEISTDKEDSINAIKEGLSKAGIEYYIENKEDSIGFISKKEDEDNIKGVISNSRNLSLDEKGEIRDSFKVINDRKEAAEKTKELTSSKTKKKSKEKTKE